MSGLRAAFWAETLKARRSVVLALTAAASLLLPLVAALFMVILKDPARAQAWGLIGMKARIAGQVADWPTFLYIVALGATGMGSVLFAIIAAWVFGRELSDHTAKEWLALPVGRSVIVAAKLLLIWLWGAGLMLEVSVAGLALGYMVHIPGWSWALGLRGLVALWSGATLCLLLTPWVAFFAGVGRGYLLPLGWALLTLALAQVAATLGWGGWFPWAAPLLAGDLTGAQASEFGLHSLLAVGIASVAGAAATFRWWLRADQAK